jgi:CysZ protein
MSVVGRYLSGARLLARGVGMYARAPRLLLLGLIPVVIVAAVFLTAFVVLLFFIDEIAGGLTWFAEDWSETPRTLVELLVGIAVLGAAVLLGVLTFTQVTLAVGEPAYERISRRVEDWCGGAPPEVETGFWRSFGRGLTDSARLLAMTAAIGIPLFFAGLLPAVGQTVVPVLGATVGGWFLAVELVGVPFNRRGLRMVHRRQALRRHRAEALGFGTVVFVCFLIPGGAVLFMPAAVAGGTLLARKAMGLPHQLEPR